MALAALGVAACDAVIGRADAATPAPLWREKAAGEPTPAVMPPGQASLAPLIKLLKPAVVNISTTTVVKNPHRFAQNDPMFRFFHDFFGQQPPEQEQEQRGQSLGSGFIINSGGYVLTNNHVIENATDIKVRLADEREFGAKVVGRDPMVDVALLKLDAKAKDLPTVPLGNSDSLDQGDFVLAMGNPFGLAESASFGIVSAKDRVIGAGRYDDFIQTDASINPGNSGGPLFNLKGEVVGINTAIVSPQIGQGIGFAVPVNMVKQVLPQLQEKGRVSRGWLGVAIGQLTPDLAQGFKLPADTKGVVVSQVTRRSPADRAGVKAGDVVVALNGKPVDSPSVLSRGVAALPPGSKAQLDLLRNGQRKRVNVTLGDLAGERGVPGGEQGGEEEEQPGPESEGGYDDKALGMKLVDVTPELAQQLGLQGQQGVLVEQVRPDGPAARANVQRGDVILEVNRIPVAHPPQYAQQMKKLHPGDMALLRVARGAAAMYVAIRVPGKGGSGG